MKLRKKVVQQFFLTKNIVKLLIVGIILFLAVWGFEMAQRKARDEQRFTIIQGIQVSLECYRLENSGRYPNFFNWGEMDKTLRDCFPARTVADPLGGESINDPQSNDWVVGGKVVYDYSSAAPYKSYEITLKGEAGTYSFKSPQ